MRKKRKIIYGVTAGTIVVGAAVGLGVSATKEDRKPTVFFELGQKADKKDQIDHRTQAVKNFETNNKVLEGRTIQAASASAGAVWWGTDERLVKVDRDDLIAALDNNPDVYTYYYGEVDKVTLKPETSDDEAGDEAYDDAADTAQTKLSSQELKEKGHEVMDENGKGTGEWLTPNLDPSNPKWKGEIPDNYDSAQRRYKDTVVDGGDSFSYVRRNNVITHKVVMNVKTGEIISIQDERGDEISQDLIKKIKPVISKEEYTKLNEDGSSEEVHVSYKEAVDKMAALVEKLGERRGVTIEKSAFEGESFGPQGIYSSYIAGIFDIPDYIQLTAEKGLGSTIKYKISFKPGTFDQLDSSIEFDHDIILYNQPGGAIKILDDMTKFINENTALKTFKGVWDHLKLNKSDQFTQIDITNKDTNPKTTPLSEVTKLTGVTLNDLNWLQFSQLLPGLKLEYRVTKSLDFDGQTTVQFRPAFKVFHSGDALSQIKVNVTGITQAIVDQEQKRMNGKSQIFRMKVRDIKLDALKDKPLTKDLITKYGLDGIIDPRFDYAISHNLVNADGTIKFTLKVSKTGIKSKVAPTGLSLVVTGIDETKALYKEQQYFNGLASALFHIDEIKYDANTNKRLSQADIDFFGISHKLDTTKYEYFLTNGDIKSNGKHGVTFEVKPLTDIRRMETGKAIQATFEGIDEAQAILKEQTLVNGIGSVSTNIDKVLLPAAKDAKLTQALADELNLGLKLKSDFVYTYNHIGINTDTTIDVSIQVTKSNSPYKKDPIAIKVKVVGIDRAIAIAGQIEEQEAVNKIALAKTYDMKVDDLKLAAKNGEVLKTDADFAKLGLTYHMKPGYAYIIDSPEITKDGNYDFEIKVMVKKVGTDEVDKTIDPVKTITPFTFDIKGIDDSNALKNIQDEINKLITSGASTNLVIKDLINTKITDTADVTFESIDGDLTQAMADLLNLGITLNSDFKYHIEHAAMTKDGDLNIKITVSKRGVTNRSNPTEASFTEKVTGIDLVTARLGVDKEQNAVNAKANGLKTLTVDAASLAAESDALISDDILNALGLTKKGSFIYKVTHDEITSDGLLDCTVTVSDPDGNLPTLTPATFHIEVIGIEDFKLAAEQTRVNGATAAYEVPDGELENLDATATRLNFPATATTVLTDAIIAKYGITVGGSPLVMDPSYTYKYSFNDIDADGDQELVITVAGKSTYVPAGGTAADLQSSTSPNPFTFAITGFARAQAEKDLAIEQDRIEHLSGFSGIIKEIQLGNDSGDLTDAIIEKIFSMENAPVDTDTQLDTAQKAKLALNPEYTYTYTHPNISRDGDLDFTIFVHKTGVKEIETAIPFKIAIAGIDAAIIQHINDIILNGITAGKIIETSVDKIEMPTVDYDEMDPANKVVPTGANLQELSLSFDSTSIQKVLDTITGVDPAMIQNVKDAIAKAGALVGLSSWIKTKEDDAQALAIPKQFFSYYELKQCDASGNVIPGNLDHDGYMKFTLYHNVEGLPVESTEAIIHVTGIDAEKRRVELAAEQTRLNSLVTQNMVVNEVKLDFITEASKTELTDALVAEYGLKGADGNPLVLDPTMIYYISTAGIASTSIAPDGNSVIHNDDIAVTIKVLDRTDPTMEVHDVSKTIITPTSFHDTIDGIDQQRAIVTQTDAQNEINALASGHYNMEVDTLDYLEETTPEVLKTKADFAKYGIDFDPEFISHSSTLNVEMPRKGYTYELTHTGTNKNGPVQLTITAMIVQTTGRTIPTVTPLAITTNVTGVDEAQALKAEQDKMNADGDTGSGTLNVDAAKLDAVDKAELTQDILNEYGLPMTINPNYEYKYSIAGIDKSGDMDMTIFVSKDTKNTYTALPFKVAITGIDEYKALMAAVAPIQAIATTSQTTPIAIQIHELKLDTITDTDLTQALADEYGLGFTLEPSKFTYVYEIVKGLDADGEFELTINVGNNGPIKSKAAVPITFKISVTGIDSAKAVQADLDSVTDTLQVTQPIAGTVTDGYNTSQYNTGDVLTQEVLEELTKDSLSTTNPDTTVFTAAPDPAVATRTYTVIGKTGDTLTITISDTDGDFVTTKDVTLTGFIPGLDVNNLDYPSEEITKDLAALAAATHTTVVTLPISKHDAEPLTQKWIDYLDLGIVTDSRFDYTFTNALTTAGDMDVTVVATDHTDPSIVITQVFKVAVTEAPKFDKVYALDSYAHAALTDSNTLVGLPNEIVEYIGSITDQFRGYSATYTMPEIDYNTNVVAPLVVTLKSIDDPTNEVTFTIHMIIGDQSALSGDAKTLLDAGSVVETTTVAPTVITEPTRDDKAVLKTVTDALKAITETDALINAKRFMQISAGTPLSQSILDELGFNLHVGSALGLIGDEFTVGTSGNALANGDITLTITPADSSVAPFDITVHVTGIDEYNKIKADLDGLSDAYQVQPRGSNVWTTNEYTPWTSTLTDDQLQRLTAVNEWTAAALAEADTEVIRAPKTETDPKNQIVRHITIKAKTATGITLEIVDTLNGVSYSKEIIVDGFTDDSSITTPNDLEYLHELVAEELETEHATSVTWNDFVGSDIPKADGRIITSKIKDYFGLSMLLNPEIAWTFSTDKELNADGDVELTITATFPNGETVVNTKVYTVNFKDFELHATFAQHADGTYQESDFTSVELDTLRDDLGTISDDHEFKNIVITNSQNGFGTFTAQFVSETSNLLSTIHGEFFPQDKTIDITVSDAANKQFEYKADQKVEVSRFNTFVGDANKLPDLPDGYHYEVVISENPTSHEAIATAQMLEGTNVVHTYTYHFPGLKAYELTESATNPFFKLDSDEHTVKSMSMPKEFPIFNGNTLAKDWWVYKAGDTKDQIEKSLGTITWRDEHWATPYHTTTMTQLFILPWQRFNVESYGTAAKFNFPSDNSIFGEATQGYFIIRSKSHPPSGGQAEGSKIKSFGATPTGQSAYNTWVDMGSSQYFFRDDINGYGNFGPKTTIEHLLANNGMVVGVSYLPGTGALTTEAKGSLSNDVKEYLKALQVYMKWNSEHVTYMSFNDVVAKLLDGSITSFEGKTPVYLGEQGTVSAGTREPVPTTYKDFPAHAAEEVLEAAKDSPSATDLEFDVEKGTTLTQTATDIPVPDLIKQELNLVLGAGEKITYTMPEITANGEVDATFTLEKADGTKTPYTFKVNILHYDEYNLGLDTIRAEFATMADKYDVDPRGTNVWTTNEYTVGETLTPDQVQRLTVLNEWTDAAINEAKNPTLAILPEADANIRRKVTVKEKTATTLTLTIMEEMNGAVVTKDVVLEGFTDDPAVTATNDLQYLHEITKSKLTADCATDITISNFNGAGVPLIAKASNLPLTQEVIDFFRLPVSLDKDITYTYSTDRELVEDGMVAVTITATFASGDSFDVTQNIDISFIKHHPLVVLDAPKTGTYATSKEAEAAIPGITQAIKDALGTTIDLDAYSITNIDLQDGDKAFGALTFNIASKATGSIIKLAGEFTAHSFDGGTVGTNSASKELDFDVADKFDIDKCKTMFQSAVDLRDLPVGYNYAITAEEGADGKVIFHVSVVTEGNVVSTATYKTDLVKAGTAKTLTGRQVYMRSGTSSTVTVSTQAQDVPRFDDDDKLISDWWFFKAGTTRQEMWNSVHYSKIQHGGQKTMMWFVNLQTVTQSLGPDIGAGGTNPWIGLHDGPDGKNTFNIEGQDSTAAAILKTKQTEFTYVGWTTIHSGDIKYYMNSLSSSSQAYGVIKDGTGTNYYFVQDINGVIHKQTTLTQQQKDLARILLRVTAKASDPSVTDGYSRILTKHDVEKGLADGSITSIPANNFLDLGTAATPAAVKPEPLAAGFKEFPAASAAFVLKDAEGQTSVDVKGIVLKKDVITETKDADIPQWLLDGLHLRLETGESIKASFDAITANGPVTLNLIFTDADGDQSFTIKANIVGFDEYNKAMEDLDADLAKIGGPYTVAPRVAAGWTTNEYNVGDILTEDQLQRLTAINEWTQPAIAEQVAGTDVIVPANLAGAIRTITVKSKTPTELVLEIIETSNGVSVLRKVTLTGFTDDATITTPNDLDYLSEIIDADLTAKAATTHVTVDTMGIPKVDDVELTDEMVAHMNLGFTINPEFKYTMTTDLVSVSGELTIHVKVSGENGYEKTYDFKTTIKTEDIVDYGIQDEVFTTAPTVAVGSVDIADVNQDVLDVIKKQMGIADTDTTAATAEITAIHDQYYELKITMENTMFPGIKQDAIVNVQKGKPVVHVSGLATSRYVLNAGDVISDQQFNAYVNEADRLKVLPSGYTYVVTAKSDHYNPTNDSNKGDKSFEIKIMKGSKEVDKWTVSISGLKEAYDGFDEMTGAYSYNGGTTTFYTTASKTPTSQRIAVMSELGAWQASDKWNPSEDSNIVKNWPDKEIPYSKWQSHFLVGYRGDTSQVGAIFAGEDANPVSFDYAGQFSFNKQGGTTYSVFSKGDVGWQSGNSWAAARAKSHGASTMYTFDNTVRHVYNLIAGAGHFKFAGSSTAGPEQRNVDSKGYVLAFAHAAVLMHDPESFSYLKGWAHPSVVDKYHSDFTIDGVTHSMGSGPSTAADVAMTGTLAPSADLDSVTKVLERFPIQNSPAPATSPASPAPSADEPDIYDSASVKPEPLAAGFKEFPVAPTAPSADEPEDEGFVARVRRFINAHVHREIIQEPVAKETPTDKVKETVTKDTESSLAKSKTKEYPIEVTSDSRFAATLVAIYKNIDN